MSACQLVLIEDNPADVMLVELALRENNIPCEITVFRNGEEALEALCPAEGGDRKPFIPAAILLDLNIPRINGFGVLVRLGQNPRLVSVPIAIMSSSVAPNDQAFARGYGVRYIGKPSQLEEFLGSVGRAVKEMLILNTTSAG